MRLRFAAIAVFLGIAAAGADGLPGRVVRAAGCVGPQAPGQASMDTGYAFLGENVGITFGVSCRDFGIFFADEWLKSGVSLYWGNIFPKPSTNSRTTDAYRTVDGQVQPELLMIFVSWSGRDAEAALGFDPAGLKFSDAEGGAAVTLPLTLPGPYGVTVIKAVKEP